MNKLTGIYWIKNEARYLPEYIEFHLMQGFDHFIFYDNGSNDGLYYIMEPYGDLVEIRTYPPGISRHNFWLMSQCIDEQKGKSRWIHFHAIDERIFSPTGKSIPEVLQEFDKPHIAGVCVCWVQLHSGGLLTRPEGLIIENYFKGQTVDPMYHIKTIIDPTKTSSQTPSTPHTFFYQPGCFSINENWELVNSSHNNGKYSMDKLKNFHFATMSKEEFDVKYAKGILDLAGNEFKQRPKSQQDWDYYHNNGSTEYRDLEKFIEPVKKAIQERYKDNKWMLQYINH